MSYTPDFICCPRLEYLPASRLPSHVSLAVPSAFCHLHVHIYKYSLPVA